MIGPDRLLEITTEPTMKAAGQDVLLAFRRDFKEAGVFSRT
jgi:hypothetical protein